jgi:hypothetical protein
MPFYDWSQVTRAIVFGAVFLVPLVAVLWIWYDSSGRTDSARWYWRLILTALVILTIPAVALGAANLDESQQDVLKICGWLAIASGGVAIIGVLAYAIWGRVSHSDIEDEMAEDYGGMFAPPVSPLEPTTLTAPATLNAPEPPTVAAPTVAVPPPASAAPAGPVGAYLFVKTGADQGRQFPIGNQTTIGRGSGCGITLADSRISTEHGQLKRQGDSYVYLDLKSTNGSFLMVEGREERLRSSQALVDGDELRLGQTVLKFIRVQEGGRR